MKNDRQHVSMRTTTRVVALVALTAFALGCATYQVPPPEPVAESRVAGVYRTQYVVDGETVEVDVFLFPDGTFHEVATYETEAQPFSDVGVYRYLPETMEIEFFLRPPGQRRQLHRHHRFRFWSVLRGTGYVPEDSRRG